MAEQATAKALRNGAAETRLGAVLERLLRRIVGPFATGSLSVDLPSGQRIVLEGARSGHDAHVAVNRWRALYRLATGGDVGFAEAISDGECSSHDLKALLLWGIENSETNWTVGDAHPFWRLASRVRHGLRANTRRNSRRNIAAHYDLGNAFYAAWLDEHLNYSSGIYETATTSLEEAQNAKLKRIADLLELNGGERILEIGCGWGALAHSLIAGHRCHVTGLTLSIEQLKHARERLKTFEERADLRLQDYRDVTGTYDRIASIEMMEAVGEAFWPIYFSRIASCLSGGGTAVLQAITIDESRFDAYRRQPDFIQLNIFPGGMLPTKAIIASQARRAGLEIVRAEYFGSSYARTLADWRIRFTRAWPKIKPLGFDEKFRRLWEYYLVYCEAGFEAGWIDVGLYQLRQIERSGDLDHWSASALGTS
jgi:cyclopropane-fatty-acyl-phospholipid synthase